jgi:hypothetical protein
MTVDPIEYYQVQYRFDDEYMGETRVVIREGYTTFEDIRTILAVKQSGAQAPERVGIVSIQRVPSPEEAKQLSAVLRSLGEQS